MKKAVIATIIFLVVLASPFIVNAASGNVGTVETLERPGEPDSTTIRTELAKRAGATKCVEETDYMRVNHMQILKDERVNYVREAIRTDRSTASSAASPATTYERFLQGMPQVQRRRARLPEQDRRLSFDRSARLSASAGIV